jgi:tRNA threonylcarbamoyladenosine biosynthesis protein TsaE
MIHFSSHAPAETEAFAARLAALLRPGDLLALRGGMGMGKTAFVRGLAKGLGIAPEEVSSPTFSLVHEYEGRVRLCHIDMYRISSFDDLYSTGFFDYLDAGAVLAVEWSENIDFALADLSVITVTLAPGAQEQDREITVEGDDRF